MGNPRARYTLEFKLEAVRMVKGGQSLAAVAKILDIRPQTLHTPAGLIALSLQEIRRLLCALAWRARQSIDQVLAWSRWRRAHQWRARQCHYRARGCAPPE